MKADLLEVEVFESAIAGLLEPDEYGHHLAEGQASLAMATDGTGFELFSFEIGHECLAEIVKLGEKG